MSKNDSCDTLPCPEAALGALVLCELATAKAKITAFDVPNVRFGSNGKEEVTGA